MTTPNENPADLIPLAAGAIALGYTPESVYVLLSKGKFTTVPVYRVQVGKKLYSFVSRAEVLAALKARPHLTKTQYAAIKKAHRTADRSVSVSPKAYDTVAQMLAAKEWLSTAEVARALGINEPQVSARARKGMLPFELEADPESRRGARRAKALDVAAHLATMEPSWPIAERFAAVPALGLDEVKLAVGDDSPAGAGDPVTQAFLRSRETISTTDFALILGVEKDTLKRRIQRGHVQTVEDPSLTGSKRKHKRIRSDYAADVLSGAATA